MNYSIALLTLCTFRQALYRCFDRRAAALFDLLDALLTAGSVPSPAHLSQEAVHRRGWGSLYAALAQGRLNLAALQVLVAQYPLAEGQPIYAVDTSVWIRGDAETSPERGYYYHPSRHSAGQPIVAGWSYSWISQLSFARDSWTAPVDVARVPPTADGNAAAVAQIKALLGRLPADDAMPLFVCDAGYDPLQMALAWGDTRAALLVRLRKNRCFYADPDLVTVTKNGRPRRHGHKFACKQPTTWLPPTDEYGTEDETYGAVRVRAWAGLHAIPQNHATKGSRQPKPLVRGTLILVEISRLPGRARPLKALWLWWHAPQAPDLAIVWRAYVRRFDEEHTLRFLKQTLNWTTPRVRHPEQADRWTWLVLAGYTQLRLARACGHDQRLPWERRLRPPALTPYRVRRAFPHFCVSWAPPPTCQNPAGARPGAPKGVSRAR